MARLEPPTHRRYHRPTRTNQAPLRRSRRSHQSHPIPHLHRLPTLPGYHPPIERAAVRPGVGCGEGGRAADGYGGEGGGAADGLRYDEFDAAGVEGAGEYGLEVVGGECRCGGAGHGGTFVGWSCCGEWSLSRDISLGLSLMVEIVGDVITE